VPNRAAGYQLSDGKLYIQELVSPTANSTADGSLYLSALDYAQWDGAMLSHKILKPESWAEIGQPARLASGHTYPYGFGWYLERTGGQDIWRHSGSWQGFQAFVIRYLGDELTLIALANSDNATPNAIVRHVAGMLEPKLAQPSAAPIEDREPRITGQFKTLLQQISAGKADYNDFTLISKPELVETLSDYRKILQPLGPLREIALFARKELGDDRVYHYRARYDSGLLDISASHTPEGKITHLDFTPAEAWDAPIQE
jgi:CubicO group peptidase (beta-lactamase class C family)